MDLRRWQKMTVDSKSIMREKRSSYGMEDGYRYSCSATMKSVSFVCSRLTSSFIAEVVKLKLI